ncbi:hypothetical protein CAPTEDRAFT_197649 [Capitella teleta]|uniref:SUEL-type lectin domain-containing protein n=1 Tax=Capitella teleta TaxID=283909 RepID=R7VHA6_CAPTE|nr:hypothetical protein CAPTEDRAFT_197649 [Capitella teleta]|eukprot:ELU18009.1 hypothetical protein CAPTEDRAFT_197649 [Capitella teleta]
MDGVEMYSFLFFVISVVSCILASEEVCFGQDFNGRCTRGDYVLMKSALLGRMELGGCLDTDLGYIGCHQDVTSRMDVLCSGRSSCRIQKMTKQDFDEVAAPNTCPNGLELYLDVDYECVQAEALPITTLNAETGVELNNILWFIEKALSFYNYVRWIDIDSG